MNTIENYVETMFKNIEMTEELESIKQEFLNHMQEKYEELRSEGKSENEAVGTVIAEFGNIDELLEEMDYEKTEEKETQKPKAMVVTEEEAFDYIEAKRKAGLGIALGTLSTISGVGLLLIGLHFFNIGIGLLALVFFLALGIGLFIVNGLRLSDYQSFHEAFILTTDARRMVTDLKKEYKRSFAFGIVLGVCICILSVSPMFLSLAYGRALRVATGAMIILIGLGVFFFIYTGNVWGAYSRLLDNGYTHASFKEAMEMAEKHNRVSQFINSIFWPIVTVIYLSWSFYTGYWFISWIIWPVAGILQSIIYFMFGLNETNKDKKW